MVAAGGGAADAVRVRYRRADGEFTETTLDRLLLADVLNGLPVRDFRSYKGRLHYSGWYWSATMARLVAYESRLELARILLADFDPGVTGLAAQPFLLAGADGGRVRRHVPDLLLAGAGGAVTVVDVKAPSRMADPAVRPQFAWTQRVCAGKGWAFEAWSGSEPRLLGNVRFLAVYRRSQVITAGLIPAVLEAARQQQTISAIELQLSCQHRRELVRPVVLHLLWTGQPRADLGQVIGPDTPVRSARPRLCGAKPPVKPTIP
jgi:hypothetical protein